MDQKQAKADELFFVVDEHDNPLDPLPRREVHGTGVWHRAAHVWLVNDAGEILCQQRSLHKELNPGKWEAFFGGHLSPGESYQEAAVRELTEETGIACQPEELHFWKVFQFHHPTGYNNEFQGIFTLSWNGDATNLRFDDGEVEQVAWRSPTEIRQALETEDQTAWTFVGYELQLLHELTGEDEHG